MAKGEGGRQPPVSTGPWKGVRDLADPFAVPRDYLLRASNMYIPDPKGGSGIYSRPGFKNVALIGTVPVISDALVRTKVVFMDNFSSGIAQSLGGGTVTRVYGRYMLVSGTFTYSATGGRDGGGYIEAATDGLLLVQPPAPEGENHGDPDYTTLLGPGEPERFQGTVTTCHNLNGQTFDEPKVLQRLGGQMVILLMPDRTIRAANETSAPFTLLGDATTFTVPATGWFVVESQGSIAPEFYDQGGFILSNLYTESGPAIGDPVVRAIGVDTTASGGAFASFGIGIPALTRSCMLALGNPFGDVKRWLYDVLCAPAVPYANGDTNDSFINYERSELIGLDKDTLEPKLVGMNLVWGASARYLNVLNSNYSCLTSVSELSSATNLGELSPFTNTWESGPFYPPSTDAPTRNQIRDDGTELYRVQLARPGVVELEAISPFALVGVRTLQASDINVIPYRLPWPYTGPHPNQVDDDLGQWLHGGAQAYYRLITKQNGVITLGRPGMAITPPNFSEWRSHAGYSLSPDSVLDAREIDPADLPQVGLVGDFAKLDAIDPTIDPATRWIQVDVGQAGLDVLYRKRIVVATETPDRAPIAFFKTYGAGTDLDSGLLAIYDLSVDFNGTYDELITGVVTRTIDWGDGSDPEDIGPGVVDGDIVPVEHTFSHGTYTLTLTVTNAAGLTAIYSLELVIPASMPVCLFTADPDEGDLSGLTINFADTSTSVTTTIVSQTWDFGDGGTSTSSTPSHTYAAGTYTVVHTVTDDAGQTASTSAELTVPAVPPVIGCPLSATTLSNAAGAQGDDFAGGNPPLPAYVNDASFNSYYNGSPFRYSYYSGYNSPNDAHSLDTVNLFNGRQTLKMWFGKPAATTYHGGGWSSFPSNDASPTETSNPTAATLWNRVRWRAESGVMTSGTEPGWGNGLQVIGVTARAWNAILSINGGRLMFYGSFQENSDPTTGLNNNVEYTVDLAPETTFVGRGDDLFGELIMLTETDNVAHTVRVRVWAGEACAMAGVSPIYDHTYTCYPHIFGIAFQSSGLTISSSGEIAHFNDRFTPTGALKYLWVADWEMMPTTVAANPFGVSLT